jgi:hypothetical protein
MIFSNGQPWTIFYSISNEPRLDNTCDQTYVVYLITCI